MIISLKNITILEHKKKILDNVSLDIKEGEFVTLVGPNGSGKSTLLKVMMGIIKPNQGLIEKTKNLKIGYIPQGFFSNTMIPLKVNRFLGLVKGVSQKDVDHILDIQNLKDLKNCLLEHLSGGELQRVLLARALLNKPHLLILDEPAQHLDINGQLQLYKEIGAIQKQHQCSIFMVSHDLHMVFAKTNRVICLYHHICCSGKPDLVAKDPQFKKIFGQDMSDMMAIYQHHHDHIHSLDEASGHSECDHQHHSHKE